MHLFTFLDEISYGDDRAVDAWRDFLDQYSKLILKIIWLNEHNYDQVMEKYLFVCTKLCENNFSVFRTFKKEHCSKPPDFTAWLSVVVRNLCIDAHRKQHGRKRFPKLLLSMTETDRKFFELYYWKGLTLDEIDKRFSISENDSQSSAVDILHKIEDEYIISGQPAPKRNQKVTFLPYIEGTYYRVGNGMANHENGLEEFLRTGLRQLSVKEQLVLKLRFWEDVAPLDIADILKLSPKSRVYRILKDGLARLRSYCLNQQSKNVI